MIYQGTVRDGVVVLPPDVQLPDGLRVTVQPLESSAAPRNGVPVFPPTSAGSSPGLDLVNKLRDEVP